MKLFKEDIGIEDYNVEYLRFLAFKSNLKKKHWIKE